MKTLLKISEASVIAIHAMSHLLSFREEAMGAGRLAKELKISYNHLSKVLQRLAQKKLLATLRGPRGGYYLTEKGKNCLLGDILSAIEGDLNYASCFKYSSGCGKKSCELRSFLSSVNIAFEQLLKKRLKDL